MHRCLHNAAIADSALLTGLTPGTVTMRRRVHTTARGRGAMDPLNRRDRAGNRPSMDPFTMRAAGVRRGRRLPWWNVRRRITADPWAGRTGEIRGNRPNMVPIIPSLRRDASRTTFTPSALLLAAVAAGLPAAMVAGAAAAQIASDAPSVVVAGAERRDVTPSFFYVGRVEAVETVELVARVEGFLERRDFREGSHVGKTAASTPMPGSSTTWTRASIRPRTRCWPGRYFRTPKGCCCRASSSP